MTEDIHWSSYWHDSFTQTGCLPQASPAIRQLLEAEWRELAEELAPAARVIDLACGNGAAGAVMLAANGELDMRGVDYAQIPERPEVSFPIDSQTSIENLPFEDQSFDCAISQFGFEYAGKGAADELVRILAAGGRVRLAIHHRDSVLIAENSLRREILGKLLASDFGGLVLARDRSGLQTMFDELVKTYGQHPLVLEIATACRDALRLPEEKAQPPMTAIRQGMERETSLISAMQNAAWDEADVLDFQRSTEQQIDWQPPRVLQHEDKILCWLVSGTRKKA